MEKAFDLVEENLKNNPQKNIQTAIAELAASGLTEEAAEMGVAYGLFLAQDTKTKSPRPRQFLAVLDFDPAELKKLNRHDQYVVRTPRTWKLGLVFKFPRGVPARGDSVVVQFTKEVRMHYSTPNPEKSPQHHIGDFPPGTYGVRLLPKREPYGERDVVRIYPAKTETPPKYRLVLGGWPTRSTSKGASSGGHLEGKVIFSAEGGSESATGNHGECHVCAVVEGPAMTRICHVSNTGKASEEQLAV